MKTDYGSHLADLHRAMVSEKDNAHPRTALSCLLYDGLAQITTFLPSALFTTLRAVSPQTRLDAQLIASVACRPLPPCWVAQERESGDIVCSLHELDTRVTETIMPIRLSLWWAERCNVPLIMEAENENAEMLAFLSPTVRGRLRKLCVGLRCTSPPSYKHANNVSPGPSSTFLSSIQTFPQLRTLFINGSGYTDADEKVASTVTDALRVAAEMPIHDIKLHFVARLSDTTALAHAVALQRVEVMGGRCFTNVAGLGECANLTQLIFSLHPNLHFLAPLRGASQLEKVCATACDLRSLDGLQCCLRLRYLDVSNNTALDDLSGVFAGAPPLRTLLASRCAVPSLRGLEVFASSLRTLDVSNNPVGNWLCSEDTASSAAAVLGALTQLDVFKLRSCGLRDVRFVRACAQVVDLDVSGNPLLESLLELTAAPCLATLYAISCDLRSLDGLCSCRRRRVVNVFHNARLTSTTGIAGAPALETFNARDCDLRSLAGLNACPQLKEVLVSRNASLTDFAGLDGAPSLTLLDVSRCRVRSLRFGVRCVGLAHVTITGNTELQDLACLAQLPHLRELVASSCRLETVAFLHACESLQEVTLSCNTALTSLAPLAGLQRLSFINASGCDLRELTGLGDGCPRLSYLNVDENKKLSDLSGIAHSQSLRYFSARDCALHHLDDLRGCVNLREVNVCQNKELNNVDGVPQEARLMTLMAAVRRIPD